MMDFAPPTTFSNFRVLYTPPSLYSVWPSFLPPGQNGIVYQNEITSNGRDWAGTRSTCDGTGTCNNIGATGGALVGEHGDDAGGDAAHEPERRLVHAAFGGRANYHGASARTRPTTKRSTTTSRRRCPVTIGGYSWVAFTSRRLYGNVATINPYWSDPRFQDISVQPTTKKIWIAAISTNPTPGTDPSFPAFYLPGQELLAGNSRAYFTLAACEAAGAPPRPTSARATWTAAAHGFAADGGLPARSSAARQSADVALRGARPRRRASADGAMHQRRAVLQLRERLALRQRHVRARAAHRHVRAVPFMTTYEASCTTGHVPGVALLLLAGHHADRNVDRIHGARRRPTGRRGGRPWPSAPQRRRRW